MAVAPWFARLFGTHKPLIAVIHLPPLPGAPRHASSIAAILRRARSDAARLLDGGADGLLVENFGDAPFFKSSVPPATIAALARVAAAVKDDAGATPVGVNVLRNDGAAALAVAAAAGLQFVRINVLAGVVATDQGWIEGDAATIQRLRASLCPGVRVFADARVKHATALRQVSLALEVEELVQRAHADAVLVTGVATGHAPDRTAARDAHAAAQRVGAPLLVASGVTARALPDLAPACDGFITGTALKQGGVTAGPVAAARVRTFVAALRRARAT